MKNSFLRPIPLLLTVLMLLSVMTACRDGSGGSDTTAPSSGADTAPGEETTGETRYSADLPDGTVYTGETFRVYAYPKDVFVWYDYDWQNNGITGAVINDAVYKRTSYVEEKLGIEVEVYHSSAYTNCSELINAVSSGESLYEIANINCLLSFSMAQSGYIAELNGYGDIQLDAPWWDQNCLEGLSIHNKNFCLTGDIGTMYKRSIDAILFNKEMMAKYPDFANPYELVENGGWTLDSMYEMASAVAVDLNSDGIYDTSDQYGLVYFPTIARRLPISCGVSYATKNSEDEPVMTLYSEKTINILERSAKLLYDKSLSYNVTSDDSDKESIMWEIFMADRSLFYYGELHSAEDMRSMDSDFGILPLPKFDTAQESYHHSINANVAAVLVIPKTNQAATMTSHILDTLGAESKNELTPAYYSINLQGQISKDEESTVCLDIIIDTLRYDIGYLAVRPAGNLMAALNKSFSTDLASAYKRQQSSIDKTLSELIADIDAKY